MDMKILEFLFAGPLFSIYKVLNEIKGAIMGLKQDLQAYNDRLDTITGELRSDFQALNDKLANTPAAEDVSEEMASLGQKISNLEGLDQPNVSQLPADPGTGGGSPGEPPVDEPQVNPLDTSGA